MSELYKRIVASSILGLIGTICFIFPLLFFVLLSCILLEIICCELPTLFSHNRFLWFMAPIWPILPFVFLMKLNFIEQRFLLYILFLLVFSADVGAFIVGKKYGRHKIAPAISPGKSWEGFAGGWSFCMMTLVLLQWFLCASVNPFFCFWFSFLITFVGAIGDFFESLLKRKAHIKDSGQVLPGHGGFLDRLDAVLFVTPLFWLFQKYLSAFLCL